MSAVGGAGRDAAACYGLIKHFNSISIPMRTDCHRQTVGDERGQRLIRSGSHFNWPRGRGRRAS